MSQSPCMGYARIALPKIFADLTGTLLQVDLKYSLHDHSLQLPVLYILHARMLNCFSRVPMDCSLPVVSLQTVQAYRLQLLYPRDSPGHSSGVGFHDLLQAISPSQGSSPRLLHLLHCQAGSIPLLLPGKPSTLCNSTLFVSFPASQNSLLFFPILICLPHYCMSFLRSFSCSPLNPQLHSDH